MHSLKDSLRGGTTFKEFQEIIASYKGGGKKYHNNYEIKILNKSSSIKDLNRNFS